MKVVSIVGARPQFVKCAPVSRALRRSAKEILVHTGQHYDSNMSASFFEELGIPEPDYNLEVGSGTHGAQTSGMLSGIERVLLDEKPDAVLVYGDTNSTLAGSLAASKLLVPLAHVEAGLRSFNKDMPEEQNRIIADHLSKLLFCPTETAVENLRGEGVRAGVYLVGDVMYDSVTFNVENAAKRSRILHDLSLEPKRYFLATVHRAESTDNEAVLGRLLHAFSVLAEHYAPIVFPIHPRTRDHLRRMDLKIDGRITLIDPIGYLDMLALERNSRMILTDSGGVQKEAFWLGVPCVTLRDQTEWVETVHAGWNILAGSDIGGILQAVDALSQRNGSPAISEDGKAAERIVELILGLEFSEPRS